MRITKDEKKYPLPKVLPAMLKDLEVGESITVELEGKEKGCIPQSEHAILTTMLTTRLQTWNDGVLCRSHWNKYL